MMTNSVGNVVAGVDTHADTHRAAVVSITGALLGDAEFPAAGLQVAEVIRPSRAARRGGKSDPIDAYAAARAALADPTLPVPKAAVGDSESLRVLLAARRSAMRARVAAQVQITSLLVTAPEELRAQLRGLSALRRHAKLRSLRPNASDTGSVTETTRAVLRLLARRCAALDEEVTNLDEQIDALSQRAAPALRAAFGVGPVTAAQLVVTAGDNPERLRSEGAFAMLAGTAPIPASSGKTTRFRLNRGGDRAANAAIHRIALVRISHDQRSREYFARRLSEGKTKKEALRALKRAIAREVFQHLVKPQPVEAIDDLRAHRLRLGYSMNHIAPLLTTNINHMSRVERGIIHDPDFTHRYRQWLTNAA